MRIRVSRFVVIALFCGLGSASPAADCDQTSVRLIPINDLGAGLYLEQYAGGLYPEGSNLMPTAHFAAGISRAMNVVPRDATGDPSPAGTYVLLSIGMSNTTQEYSRFAQLASASDEVNHDRLRIVDGAAGGQTAATWDSPTDANYDRVRDEELAPLGLTEAQVQAAWVKVANANPSASLPAPAADAMVLLEQMGDIARALKARYPNLQVVFLSSRIYAGYASTALNPEPYAYESAFSVKWLVQAQITQHASGAIDPVAGDLNAGGPDAVAPWLAWGPYLWADGLTPRSDGLTWLCSDLQADGTHPSPAGREKVAQMLLGHLIDSPHSRPWFRAVQDADVDNDGTVGVSDLLQAISQWGFCEPYPSQCPADIAPRGGDGHVNTADILKIINRWGTVG